MQSLGVYWRRLKHAQRSRSIRRKLSADLSNDDLSHALDKAELVVAWVNLVRAEASQRADKGETIPNWKLVPKRAMRKWTDDNDALAALNVAGVPLHEVVKIVSVAAAERAMKAHKKKMDPLLAVDREGVERDDPGPRRRRARRRGHERARRVQGYRMKINRGSPESFGWQRRPDLDTETGVAYEKPDGVLYLFEKRGPKPELVRASGFSLRADLDYRNLPLPPPWRDP